MRTSFRALVVAFSCCILLVSAQEPPPAQEDQQAPPVTFRMEVNYVEVDAIVTDQNGLPVTDLTASDFEIFEGGEQQEITNFSLVNIPIERSEQPLFASAPIEPDVKTNQDSGGRLFLIVLDSLHTEGLNALRVKDAAHNFIDRNMGANDLAGIVHMTGRSDLGQDFTRNRRLLKASIDKFVGEAPRSSILERMDRFNALGIGSLSIRNPVSSVDYQVYDPFTMERISNARTMFSTVGRLAEFMANVRGRRKALILVSEGVPFDLTDAFTLSRTSLAIDDFRDLIGSATRSNVSIYTVDPRGLTVNPAISAEIEGFPNPNGSPGVLDELGLDPVDPGLTPSSLAAEQRYSQDGLRTLAAETGGLAAVNTNNFERAFRRIIEDNSTYYVLGYYPTNERRGGRFRKIDLRLKRPGLQVRARRGYYEPRGRADTESSSEADTSAELRAAMSSPIPMPGIPMRVFAAPFKGTAPNASVALTVELEAGRFNYGKEDELSTNLLEINVAVIDGSSKFVTGAEHKLALRFKPDTLEAIKTRGLRLMTQVQLPPGRYQMRVASAEQEGKTSGTVLYDIEVPDFWESPLTMSGVMLTSTAAGLVPTVGQGIVDLGPVLPGPPTTVREFNVDEDIAVFAEVYENAPDMPPHVLDLSTTVRSDVGQIVFENREERSSTELEGGRGGFGYSVEIPSSTLAPGLYVIHLEARSRIDNDSGIGRDIQIRIH